MKQSTPGKNINYWTGWPDMRFEDRIDFGEDSRGLVEKAPESLERGGEEVYL